MYRKEQDIFTGYEIRDRGDGELCAAFSRSAPVRGYTYRAEAFSAEPTPVVHEIWEDVFTEESLAERVGNGERQGLDVSLSREALAALRARKASPTGP